jgi:transcriptional regulator with XRE-family HTH domain
MLADGTARDLRLRSGLSLDAVARPVGITAGALWKWETGMRVPRVGEAAVRYGQLLAELLALDEV